MEPIESELMPQSAATEAEASGETQEIDPRLLDLKLRVEKLWQEVEAAKKEMAALEELYEKDKIIKI